MNIPDSNLKRGDIVSVEPDGDEGFLILDTFYNPNEGKWYATLFSRQAVATALIGQELLRLRKRKSDS